MRAFIALLCLCVGSIDPSVAFGNLLPSSPLVRSTAATAARPRRAGAALRAATPDVEDEGTETDEQRLMDLVVGQLKRIEMAANVAQDVAADDDPAGARVHRTTDAPRAIPIEVPADGAPLPPDVVGPASSVEMLVSALPEWKALEAHVADIGLMHLRDLLKDERRCESLRLRHDNVLLDWSRQKANSETMRLLFALAKRMRVEERVSSMFKGETLNRSEDRAVLHTALRAPKSKIGTVVVGGVDIVAEVHGVRAQIKEFADAVRSGKVRGATGKKIRTVLVVGIGGSFLGPNYVGEALATDAEGSVASEGFDLRFVANVDPTGFARAIKGARPEETLCVVVSKSWTTAETQRNAAFVRVWLQRSLKRRRVSHAQIVAAHFAACSAETKRPLVEAWGIEPDRIFNMWDWVGGRYSSCSSAGVLPLSIVYGNDVVDKFLAGAHSMDFHFSSAPLEKNMPVIMGLLGLWNANFLRLGSRAVIPYSEALHRFPAHIQQMEMESNGKSVTLQGSPLDYTTGEIVFGEPGTNSQHSFFQLLHMGQCVPTDFIGFARPQIDGDAAVDDAHNELMSNFFAQPDALAEGKTFEECVLECSVEDDVVICPHRTLSGDRPSLTLLMPRLTAYSVGQLLALYEHRTAVQGFVWDINSWDQWGVELGKKLAKDITAGLDDIKDGQSVEEKFNPSTAALLNEYHRLQASGREMRRQ